MGDKQKTGEPWEFVALRAAIRFRHIDALFSFGTAAVFLEVELAAAFGNARGMTSLSDVLQLRVRYSEIDQMGTFYNSRALEWFECGRTELMRRKMGMSYAEMEARGSYLPLVEAHLEFPGGARYDDLLDIATMVSLSGRARLRFEVQITQAATGKAVVRGYTVHAFTDAEGKPIRPPGWFVELLEKAGGDRAEG